MKYGPILLPDEHSARTKVDDSGAFGKPLDAAGGEGGIRTPDRLAPMPHFECGAFDHSATSPGAMTGLPPSVGRSSRRGWRRRQGAVGRKSGSREAVPSSWPGLTLLYAHIFTSHTFSPHPRVTASPLSREEPRACAASRRMARALVVDPSRRGQEAAPRDEGSVSSRA
jgi:hypothetical protein